MYYGTLLDAAKIAEKIGDAESADMWRKKADLVRYQINARLYDEETERYISTIYAGERIQASPHAQAWSLAYHVPPETKIDLVVNSLLDLLSDNPRQPNVEIYGMYWVLKGLGDFEYIAEALQILETYYGNLINLGATTWWEVFNADSSDLYYESLAHGWGGSPTWFLTKYVLGIQIEQKDSWTVKPSFAHFRAITGSVPFQGNTLVVRWQKPNCQKMELEIQSPDTASGEVVLPNLNNTGVITMNESVIWKRGQPLTEGVVEKSDGIHITLLEADELIFDMHQQCNWIYLPQVENR
jgi:alpha-L-rhamnosidase